MASNDNPKGAATEMTSTASAENGAEAMQLDQNGKGVGGREESHDRAFILTASVFQLFLVILYAVSSDYNDGTAASGSNDEFETTPFYYYSMFQDVHAMMFVGFGFLMTFLRKYGFGALSFNFLLCAFGIQWGMYTFSMAPWLFGEDVGRLEVTGYKLIDGDIATAVVLISFGALLGRTNPAPLLVMCFVELMVWAINFHLCIEYLGVVDVGGSILVHVFGAYFGLAVSKMLGRPDRDDENQSVYHSDMFSMVGTLFLWLYWPSFNGFFANRDYFFMDRAFVNTVLALCGATVATFIVSRWVNIRAKGLAHFNMMHIQNATLAGGVAVGCSADLYLHPAGALFVGMCAGTLSVVGYEFLSSWIEDKLGIADTCGVHNLHGMPGVFAAIVSAIAIAAGGTEKYDADGGYPFGHYSPSQQALYQLAALAVTLSMAIGSGLVVGYGLSFAQRPEHEFVDIDNFEVPHLAEIESLRDEVRAMKRPSNGGARYEKYQEPLLKH